VEIETMNGKSRYTFKTKLKVFKIPNRITVLGSKIMKYVWKTCGNFLWYYLLRVSIRFCGNEKPPFNCFKQHRVDIVDFYRWAFFKLEGKQDDICNMII